MAFPISPVDLDFYNGYMFENSVWKKKQIAESGSNTNGNWIKYPNGIMMQWGKFDAWAPATTVISYPSEFYEEPTVIALTPRSDYNVSIGTGDIQPTVSSFKPYIQHLETNADAASSTVHWIAIGLWKPFTSFNIDMDETVIGSRYLDPATNAYKKIPPVQAGGTTDNYWIEFDNSTLIQWGRLQSVTGNDKVTIPYSRSFLEEPSVSTCMARNNYKVSIGTNDVQPTISSLEACMQNVDTTTVFTTSTKIHWMAFGRSK